MKYTSHFSVVETPQSGPIPGKDMKENNAGGYAFEIDQWKRLDRFLILGAEGGTYYVKERKFTVDNANNILTCICEDGPRTVARVAEISFDGRAPRNAPAQFALALCIAFGDEATRREAYLALPKVCRIPTHLFGLLQDLKQLKPNMWSAGLRRAISRWYNDKPIDKLAYHIVKYRQREGWTHKDALICAHPKPIDGLHNALYNWTVNGEGLGKKRPSEYQEYFSPLDLIWAYEQASVAESAKEVIGLILDHNLPWEAIDTKWLSSADVWAALLPNLPLTAMIRNLARMTANGLLAPMSEATITVAERITYQNGLRKARVHPIQVLSALATYRAGRSGRSDATWKPVTQIIDALDEAFYLSFGNIEPTGRRTLLALDVSGSMTSGTIAGAPGLTPRVGSAAMALVTAKIEKYHYITAFCDTMIHVDLSHRQRLDDVIRATAQLPFGGTDCALPMLYALENGIDVDTFIIYTDSETWYGDIHPAQALQKYRNETKINAKLIVVGMTATEFSIADPNDPGMIDVVGFDTAAPQLIADFSLGRI